MKIIVIKFITLALSALMLISLTACGGQGKTDSNGKGNNKTSQSAYNDMIDEFVPSSLNTFELTIGDTHAPDARMWLQSGNGTTYSSDENVVTVTDGGKVTAVGEGSAYVVITATKDGKMYMVYRYDVYGKATEADLSNLPTIDGVDFATEIANFNSTPLNTYELKVSATHSPTASLWAQSGGECYTSDESVVTVNTSGNVTAVGKGTAYVIITSGVGRMFEIYKYIVKG